MIKNITSYTYTLAVAFGSAVLVAALPSMASAATYYISPTGSDSNSGTNTSTPWATIAKVKSFEPNLIAGDSVLFQRGGVWLEELQISNIHGTTGAPITFSNYGTGSLPVIDGASSRLYGIVGAYDDGESANSYITIDGFEVRNATRGGIIFSYLHQPGMVIKNNYIHNNGYGAYPGSTGFGTDDHNYGDNEGISFVDRNGTVSGCDGTKIMNNTVNYEGGHNSIMIDGDSCSPEEGFNLVGPGCSHNCMDDKMVTTAFIHDNTTQCSPSTITVNGSNYPACNGNGFYSQSDYASTSITYERNIAIGAYTGYGAFSVQAGTTSCPSSSCVTNDNYYNNTAYTTDSTAFVLYYNNCLPGFNINVQNDIFDGGKIKVGSGCTVGVADYNDQYNTTVVAGTLSGPHDLSVDPQFVNAAALDFHLQSTSPLLNAGNQSIIPGVTWIGALGTEGVVLTAFATASPTSGTAPLAVSLTGSASGGTSPYTYGWNFGDSTTGSGAAVSHTYTTAGTYTATLTVTDSAAHTATASQTITVSAALVFDFSLSNNGNVSVVQGSSVANTITATLSSGSTQSVSFSPVGLPSGASASFSPTSCSPTCSSILTITTASTTPAGSYTVTITGTGGGITHTTSFILSVSGGASANIVFHGTSTATVGSTATSVSVPKPSGTVQNDVIAVAIYLNQNANTNGNVTAPDGSWQEDIFPTQNSGSGALAVFHKITGASEPASYSFGVSFGSGTPYSAEAVAASYGNVNTSAPLDVPAAQTLLSGSTTASAPSLAIPTGHTADVLIALFAISQSNVTVSTPSGMISRNYFNDTNGGGVLTWFDQQLTASGSTGVRTATLSSSNSPTGVSIAFVPAGAASDTTPPSVPTGLSASAVSTSQINLSWTASTDNVGVTGYKVYRCQGASCTPTLLTTLGNVTSYSDTGLTPSTQYSYTISAFDALGNNSAQSESVNATTLAAILAASGTASPTSGSVPLIVSFTGSASGGIPPYTYSWNFGDGSAVSTLQNPSHTYFTAGTYTVTLTVTDSVSHTATASWTIMASGAAYIYVQSASAGLSGVTSISKKFPAANGTGHTIIVTAGEWCKSSTLGTLSVKDTMGNIYTLATQSSIVKSSVSASGAKIWYTANAKGGSNTVTVTDSASCDISLGIHEYSGLGISVAIDASHTAVASGGATSVNTGTITTHYANDLIFSFGFDQTNCSDTWTMSSGWTTRQTNSNPGCEGLRTADMLASPAGTYSNLFTINKKSNGLHGHIVALYTNGTAFTASQANLAAITSLPSLSQIATVTDTVKLQQIISYLQNVIQTLEIKLNGQ